MKTNEIKVAVLGAGYWGRNLVRNFHELGALACVCDVNPQTLAETQAKYGVETTQDFEAVLANPEIHAVVIAAPAAQHYALAKRALASGKDVYVEKPLALHCSEGEELVQVAAQAKRLLMVGHILEYHPALVALKEMVRRGDLGKIQYIYSSRLNLGKLRTEENILWSFAPHDISAILALLAEKPVRVSAHGGKFLDGRFDTTMTTCDFNSGVKAHIFVSWLHPFKEQKLTIVGDRMMAVFDDTEADRKLVVYEHRIDWPERVPVAHKAEGKVIELEKAEPLRLECEHFLHCVATREEPRTNGVSALRVLEVLESCERSLLQGGQPVENVASQPAKPVYFAHPTAVIDGDCTIGPGTKIWHFSHVMSGSTIGERCNIGQNVVVSPGVKIGRNVKIQNNVSVYTGVELEDDVFCGPSMVFTNVVNPRSHIIRRDEYRKTLVKRGASLGANSTIVCGITIGEYAFVGAGAVVTRDVPAYALVVGAPARVVGWMCYCGIKLAFGGGQESTCSACGRRYLLDDQRVREILGTEAKQGR